MNDIEATAAWDTLKGILLTLQTGEILERVEAYLREGKLQEREVVKYESPLDEIAENHLPRQRGPRARYVGVVEYSPRERLEILAQAILHAVVFARQMEHDIWGYLEKASASPGDAISINSIRVAHEPQDTKPVVTPLRRDIPRVDLGRLQEALQRISEEARG